MLRHYLLVFGRNRFVLLGLAPSRMFRAVRSSGLIFLNVVLIFVFGEAIDFDTAEAAVEAAGLPDALASISNSSFRLPFRLRRSSSFQSIFPKLRRPAEARLLLN